MQAPADLRTFVRDTLGCGCPEAVFDDVAVGDAVLGAAPPLRLARIGGRLMVAVIALDDAVESAAALPALVAAGRRLRDAEGFNRFRLVFAGKRPKRLREPLRTAFDGIAGRDERLHLHVVAADTLPATLRRSRVTTMLQEEAG